MMRCRLLRGGEDGQAFRIVVATVVGGVQAW